MKQMIIFVLMLLVSFTLSTPAKSSMTKEKAEKKAIVLAVFGTTYPAALQSIVNLQQKMEDAFPGIPVQVAFTSGFIRAKWGKRANDPKWRRDHPEVFAAYVLCRSRQGPQTVWRAWYVRRRPNSQHRVFC